MITHKINKYKPPVQHYHGGYNHMQQEALLTQEELNRLIANNMISVGDMLCYQHGANPMSLDTCSVVCYVEHDLDKVHMGHIYDKNKPYPYMIMGLAGTSHYSRERFKTQNIRQAPHVRWDDGVGLHIVSPALVESLTDDYVSDYLKEFCPIAETFLAHHQRQSRT